MTIRTKWILPIVAAACAAAQTALPGLTISQAVAAALENYPSIRVTQEQMNSAAARIRLAQTAYLPHIDALAQVNRATRNTFYGLLLRQGIIPGVDGNPTDNLGSVWDSGAGVLVTWQPFDFGLRAANVAAAAAARHEAEAGLNRTRYEVAVAAADAFLTVLAADETAKAARASAASWETLARTIHGLVAA
jgi:outer membrane protein